MENDQSIKADAGKLQLTLVPTEAIRDIAAIRMFGMERYPDGGRDNWKRVDVQRYRDAAYRHWLKYLDDPDALDDESGLPHLWHWICNAAFLCELEKERYKKVTSHTKPITEWVIDGKSIVATPETVKPIINRMFQNMHKDVYDEEDYWKQYWRRQEAANAVLNELEEEYAEKQKKQ